MPHSTQSYDASKPIKLDINRGRITGFLPLIRPMEPQLARYDTHMFLTDDQVRQLTRCSRKRRQIEVLKQNNIPFCIGADGWPVVAVASIEGQQQREKKRDESWKPSVLINRVD